MWWLSPISMALDGSLLYHKYFIRDAVLLTDNDKFCAESLVSSRATYKVSILPVTNTIWMETWAFFVIKWQTLFLLSPYIKRESCKITGASTIPFQKTFLRLRSYDYFTITFPAFLSIIFFSTIHLMNHAYQINTSPFQITIHVKNGFMITTMDTRVWLVKYVIIDLSLIKNFLLMIRLS